MVRQYVLCGLALVLFAALLSPHECRADDWSFSPYRAQFAQAQGEPSASLPDSATSPVVSGKKSIGRGIMFSLVIPGTGQLYSGPWWRALPWFAIEVTGWAVFASYHAKGTNQTNDFEAYAGWRDTPNHFNTSAYMFAEWKVASDSVRARDHTPTTDNFEQWMGENFDYRDSFLPAPFTHDIMTTDRQQFFEMIGKYLGQFGFGWQDTYNNGSGGTADESHPPDWTHPAAGLRADTANTIAFDGDSPMFYHYADMRGKANDLLNNANRAMEVVMVNHIISALDAAIAVHNYNRKITAKPSLGDLHLQYDAKYVRGNMTRYLTLSVPLDVSN